MTIKFFNRATSSFACGGTRTGVARGRYAVAVSLFLNCSVRVERDYLGTDHFYMLLLSQLTGEDVEVCWERRRDHDEGG